MILMDHTFKKLITTGINSNFPKHEFITTQPATGLMRQSTLVQFEKDFKLFSIQFREETRRKAPSFVINHFPPGPVMLMSGRKAR